MKTGSICLSDIPKDKITVAKNGKKYLNVTVFENDQPDRYGNHESIQVGRSKEECDAGVKAVYIGNLKDWSKVNNSTPSKLEEVSEMEEPEDDLPF